MTFPKEYSWIYIKQVSATDLIVSTIDLICPITTIVSTNDTYRQLYVHSGCLNPYKL